jgi:hypothetical protein
MSHNYVMHVINFSSFVFLKSRLSSALASFLWEASSGTPVFLHTILMLPNNFNSTPPTLNTYHCALEMNTFLYSQLDTDTFDTFCLITLLNFEGKSVLSFVNLKKMKTKRAFRKPDKRRKTRFFYGTCQLYAV